MPSGSLLIVFLVHEMPEAARQRTLGEVLRVLRPGGRLVVAEYGPQPLRHLLWRVRPIRALLLRLEPFLGDFWQRDLEVDLMQHAPAHGKKISLVDEFRCFAGFYRLCVFEVTE
jgi:ubiquinone/menaquinone biosynthesis C-methylase UbiE